MTPHGDLSDIIEQRLISAASRIEPTDDEPIRAIDVHGHFAAVYRLSVDAHGDWYDACSLALRVRGRWQETTTGGGHGGGWETPWRPPPEGWDGRPLAIFGSAGGDLPDDEDEMVLVRGMYGFATEHVSAIRVTQGGQLRVIEVTSPAGAFVVVVTGEDEVELQGLDGQGDELGDPCVST